MSVLKDLDHPKIVKIYDWFECVLAVASHGSFTGFALILAFAGRRTHITLYSRYDSLFSHPDMHCLSCLNLPLNTSLYLAESCSTVSSSYIISASTTQQSASRQFWKPWPTYITRTSATGTSSQRISCCDQQIKASLKISFSQTLE